MKVLHTSDWHLGHVLYNYDRSEEQHAFLRQMAEIVREERPDVMVVSGDVYHYANPSTAAQKLFTEGLLAIHEECEEMTIVVTAGNHDSGQKVEVESSLWRHFGIYVIGGVHRDGEGVDIGRHIVEVRGGDGRLKGYVAAVPHIYPNNFPALDGDTGREGRQERFFQKMLDTIKERNAEGLPVVLMAHLAVGGSDTTGHDDTIGGMEYTDIKELGEGYDYLALGHIHRPQTLAYRGRNVRYSGSPIPVSFDECYTHSVTIVEVRGNEVSEIRTIEIENPIPLVTVPDTAAPFSEALDRLTSFPEERCAYVRLNVSADAYLPADCNELASKAVEGKECRFCYIRIERGRSSTAESTGRITVEEMKEISPMEIARMYYRDSTGEEMDEELASLMDDVIKRVRTEAADCCIGDEETKI